MTQATRSNRKDSRYAAGLRISEASHIAKDGLGDPLTDGSRHRTQARQMAEAEAEKISQYNEKARSREKRKKGPRFDMRKSLILMAAVLLVAVWAYGSRVQQIADLTGKIEAAERSIESLSADIADLDDAIAKGEDINVIGAKARDLGMVKNSNTIEIGAVNTRPLEIETAPISANAQ